MNYWDDSQDSALLVDFGHKVFSSYLPVHEDFRLAGADTSLTFVDASYQFVATGIWSYVEFYAGLSQGSSAEVYVLLGNVSVTLHTSPNLLSSHYLQ